jgi:hypothetical protein
MSGKFSVQEKVALLMEEYKSLRAEIVSRTGYGMQVWTIAAAATTWLIGQSDFAWKHLFGFAAIAMILTWFTAINVRDIWKCAFRLKEIEHEVNSRVGFHLLVWERLYGAARMSFLAGLLSRIKPLPRESLPDLDTSYDDEEKHSK